MRCCCLTLVLCLSSAWGQADIAVSEESGEYDVSATQPDGAQTDDGLSRGQIANWGSCKVTPPPPMPLPPSTIGVGELEIFSGKAEIKLEGDARFTDQIALRSGDRILRADGAQFDSETRIFSVEGAVEFRDPESRVQASRAEFNQNTEELTFDAAEFQLWSVPARGAAEFIKVEGGGKLRLNEVSYTSCPEGKDDWMLRASKIRIDRNTGIGSARNARLDFKGVPILYFPYLSYPVTNERKSGWLLPNLGTSNQRGVDIAIPYYWNIAPQYDATITPRYMSRRGLQLQSEFRYLARKHDGVLIGEYLNDDDVTNKNRALLAWFHRTNFSSNWRGTIDATNVSDSAYFEDLSSGLASTSQTHLQRRMDVEWFNNIWSALLRFEDYQTIDDTIANEDEPYQSLPQLAIRGFSPRGLFGLQYTLEGEAAYFNREIGVTGVRARIRPEIARAFRYRFLDIEPMVALDYTTYSLADTLPGEPESPERTVPIFSVDLSTAFERMTKKRKWLQTVEPRAMYTYIPFRAQDDLPIFDTIEPDLNIVQLFRRNRFVGADRIGDTNQFSLGITTRLIEAANGKEFLRATIGQIRYLSSLDVTLPGGEPSDSNSSDYLAELGMKLFSNWKMRLGYQWNSDRRETQKAEARVEYRSGNSKIANVSYRFREDTLEELDVSAAWPIGSRWNLVGRYDYSIKDSKPLERFLGAEYETCCWAIRAVWRRNLTRRTGESDTSISLQLILKGFGNPASAAERLLDRGILGYD
ncbi:MAG: LPS assembly protein LptD [Gammaproteobacteria bacterium]|nr:LPS assembly protein LptD [Gammaproteobacteria bacterium]